MANEPAEQIGKAISSIPEGFYELLTYAVPAAYFLAGLDMLLFAFFGTDIVFICHDQIATECISDLLSYWPYKALILFGILAALYTTGQILNTFSHYFMNLRVFIAEGRGKFDEWIYEKEKDFALVKHHDPSYSLLVTKTRAKQLMSWNVWVQSVVLLFFTGLLWLIYICRPWLLEISMAYLWASSIIWFVFGMLACADYRKRHDDEKRMIANWKNLSPFSPFVKTKSGGLPD